MSKMLKLILMTGTVLGLVGTQMVPEECHPYLARSPVEPAEPAERAEPQPPPTAVSPPVQVCFDTRYFSLLDPQCEHTMLEYYDDPEPSFPPIVLSTDLPFANNRRSAEPGSPEGTGKAFETVRPTFGMALLRKSGIGRKQDKKPPSPAIVKKSKGSAVGIGYGSPERKSMKRFPRAGDEDSMRRSNANVENALYLGPLKLNFGVGLNFKSEDEEEPAAEQAKQAE